MAAGFADAPAAAFAASPHLTFSGGDTCGICHVPHQAATTSGLFRTFGATAGELPVCFECHDGSGSSTDIRNGADSFGGASGHVLEGLVDTSTPTDLTNACSSCHKPHGDYAARPKLPAGTINGKTVTGTGNAWCLACHDDAQSWFAKLGTYPALSSPSRDASGYPKTGTFPGASVYTSGTGNAHIRIDASSGTTTRTAGDCLYCHAAHGSAARYDGLTAAFAPSTPASVAADRATGAYAALCFTCHAGGSWETSGAPNIKRYSSRPLYRDYRVMLDEMPTIDAVIGRSSSGALLAAQALATPVGDVAVIEIGVNAAIRIARVRPMEEPRDAIPLKAAVADFLSQDEVAATDGVAPRIGAFDGGLDLVRQLRGDPLVGIDE